MTVAQTLIQSTTYLGSINFTGNDYIASHASGGIDRCRTEGECVNVFKRRMGQALKGQIQIVRADNKPTEVFLISISPITSEVFGNFAYYVAVPGAGFQTSGGLVSLWDNDGYNKSPQNTLVQTNSSKQPIYSAEGMAVYGIKGDAVDAYLATQTETPSNITIFIGFHVPGVVISGTVWSAIKADGTFTSNPDLALHVSTVGAPLVQIYSADDATSRDIASAVADTLYVLCIQRTAAGALTVYRHGTSSPLVNVTGIAPAGDRGAMALLDGFTTAGPSDVSIGALTVVSRAVTSAERTAYMAAIYDALHVIL